MSKVMFNSSKCKYCKDRLSKKGICYNYGFRNMTLYFSIFANMYLVNDMYNSDCQNKGS